MAGLRIEGAIIGVGMLVLERIPRNLLVKEGILEDEYPAALQEFKDYIQPQFGAFKPPEDFRKRVFDHLKWYIEDRKLWDVRGLV